MRKILFAGDLHKKAVDPNNISGYVNCCIAIQRELIDTIVEHKIDTFISLGDWYDRGYISDVAASLSDTEMDREMASMLRGEFYGVIGNHIRLKMDSNPELFLIQPHPVFKSRRYVPRDRQVIKTPNKLKFGTAQISFMHCGFGKGGISDFIPIRDDDTTYHIALFHTPHVIPNQQLQQAGLNANVYTMSDIAECLKGVDLAICGDIHKPIGMFNVSHPYGTTQMIVPGSLTNTDAGELNRHSEIKLPMVTISDDSLAKLEFITFDLKTNMVEFKLEQRKQKDRDSRLDGIRAGRKKITYSSGENLIELDASPSAYTLFGLTKRLGYSDVDKQMIVSILHTPLDVTSLIDIYNQETNVEEL